ncbi:hypothetical protein ANN_17754 [Periplaneta americana]|uniref:DUF4371 domain-containing protein n=1 Tax=Periplaneta americana TaxID=6978 RepID=A0ABQ8STV3_PERAM|nr:hypothetical protein ANN_17754 [Periplaneta americana]
MLVGRPEGKRPFGRQRRRWEDNIKKRFEGDETPPEARRNITHILSSDNPDLSLAFVRFTSEKNCSHTMDPKVVVQLLVREFGTSDAKPSVVFIWLFHQLKDELKDEQEAVETYTSLLLMRHQIWAWKIGSKIMKMLYDYDAKVKKKPGMADINVMVLQHFKQMSSTNAVIHDRTIRLWGVQVKTQIDPDDRLNFRASDSWVWRFKQRDRTVSRSVTHKRCNFLASELYFLKMDMSGFESLLLSGGLARDLAERGRETNVWSKEGFSNMNSLRTAVLEYDKSKAHICSSMNFANCGKTRIDLQLDKRKALHINQHNALVKKKNREILLHLINAVCFLGKQELAFRGHNESVESDNIGNYIEYLSSLSEFDHLLANHLESSTVFRGTSLAIQNDLIFAISGVMIKNIKPFVAIVVDETSDCSNQSQLSTILRYVDSTANVQERFIGFTNVSSGKTAAALFQHVEGVVAEYNVGNKLIAQTYDGASVMAGNINGLKTKVQEKYPQALFVHCYSHVLNLVLQQTTSSIPECRIFSKHSRV